MMGVSDELLLCIQGFSQTEKMKLFSLGFGLVVVLLVGAVAYGSDLRRVRNGKAKKPWPHVLHSHLGSVWDE